MAELVNAQTNQVEDVPQDNVAQALTSGSHNMIKGAPVNVLDPDGNLVSLPAEQIPEALQNQYQIPTQAHLVDYQNEQKYGEGAANTAKAFGAGALRGATLGGSDIALTKTGLVSPEALSQLSQRHEIATPAGEIAGTVGALALAPEAVGLKAAAEALNVARASGDVVKIARAVKALDAAKATLTAGDLANPVSAISKVGSKVTNSLAPVVAVNPETSTTVAKILANVTPKLAGSAVEGAAFGLGNSVSEYGLGDPDLHGENILHNVGYGALFGAGIGGVFGLRGAISKDIQHAAAQDSIIETAKLHPENPNAIPTSLEDIANHNKLGAEMGFNTDLPQKARLLETNDLLAGDSQFPAHALQSQSLESPYARRFYKTYLEGGSEQAQDLVKYEASQKQEGLNLLDKYTQDVAPDATIASDTTQAGKNAVDAFQKQYETEKLSQNDFWKKFENSAVNTIDKPHDLLNVVNNAVPNIERFVTKNADGLRSLTPYSAEMGLDKKVYDAVNDVIKSFNKPEITIKDLQGIRQTFQSRVAPLENGIIKTQLQGLRKGLLDVIENRIQEINPSLEVRDEMRKYAINEQNREFLEHDVFKGPISGHGKLGKNISYEDILPRFFADSDTVRAARQVLGNEKFDKITADYLAHLKRNATDSTKGFSSNKMASTLKLKSPELTEALAQHPEELRKIQAVTDKMRILPDSPLANPSSTAGVTKMMEKIQKIAGYLTPGGIMGLPGAIAKGIAGKIEQRQQTKFINDVLAGKQSIGTEEQLLGKQKQYQNLAKIERMGQSLTKSIVKGVDTVFSDTAYKAAKAPILTSEERQDKYDKLSSQVKEFSQNPNAFMEKVQANTAQLQDTAPNITGSLQTAASRATHFLASKLPAQEPSSPLSPPYKPSANELAQFNRYADIIHNPVQVLDQVKRGTLTKEALEAMSIVYPKMYDQMKQTIMDRISNENITIPYKTRLMISMFTGQDMTNTLKAPTMAAVQATYGSKSQKAPAGQAPQPVPGASKITSSNQALTDTQRVEQK